MIAVLRDDQDRITAVCEWITFDNKDIFIGEFEINPDHRGNGVFKQLIRLVYEQNKDFERVVWFRETKYPGGSPRIYTREQIFRHIGG
jgi:GNAT superfamily N-acetyltransferase